MRFLAYCLELLLNSLSQGVLSQEHTVTELCVILEQGVSPCRTLAFLVGGVRSGRLGTCPDGGAARCICNVHSVAEELSYKLSIRSFAAACACAGEFEQRLLELGALNGGFLELLVNLGLVGNLGYSVVEYRLLIHLGLDGLHHESALALVLCACRADVRTYAAAGAVQGGYCHGVLHTGQLHCVLDLNGSRSSRSLVSGHDNRTDNCVRANECTLVTLDTVLGNPLGNVNSDTALLICSGTLGECTVNDVHINEGGYGDLVAALCVYGDLNLVDEINQELVVALSLVLGELALAVSPGSRNVYLDDLACALVDSGVVHVDDIVALLGKGLVRHLLHVGDSVLGRNDVCDGEERGLEHGVGLVAQTDLSCHLVSVDDIEVNIVLCDVSLYGCGELLVQLVNCPVAVQQEGAAGNNVLYHVVLVDIGRVVTGNEVSLVDEVGGLDRGLTEAQVGNGNAAGLLGVVSEVSLCVHVGVVADDLDGVLVRADGTIGAESPELTAGGSLRSGVRILGDIEGQVSYIVVDTEGEYRLGGVVVYCDDLSRVAVLGTESVTAGEYLNVLELVLLLEGSYYVEPRP